MLILTLIPTGITQLIAAFLGTLNGIQGLGRTLYGWANYWFKKNQGVERDKVAQALVDDAFCISPIGGNSNLDDLLKTDACAMMWAAGVYKSDEIHGNLTVFTKGDSNDPNYPIWESPLSRALDNAVDLATRLQELADNKIKDTVRYMTTRIMIKEYMKDYLKST
ncbi:MAG: hypothetical protein GY810_24025 [Aureispira sp.]|nr:hypothetical protein [Aureispira sp.]